MSIVEQFGSVLRLLLTEINDLFEKYNTSIGQFKEIKDGIIKRQADAKGKFQITEKEANIYIGQSIDLQRGIGQLSNFMNSNQDDLIEKFKALKLLEGNIAAMRQQLEQYKAGVESNTIILAQIKEKDESITRITAELKQTTDLNDSVKAQLFASDNVSKAQQTKIKGLEASIARSDEEMSLLKTENSKLAELPSINLELTGKNEALKSSNLELTVKNEALQREQSSLIAEIDKNKALVVVCEQERARLAVLNEDIGKYIGNIDPMHFDYEPTIHKITEKSRSFVEKGQTAGGGGKRRKKTLRKKIIRRR